MKPRRKRKQRKAYFSFATGFAFAVTRFACFENAARWLRNAMAALRSSSGGCLANQGNATLSSCVSTGSSVTPSALRMSPPFASRSFSTSSTFTCAAGNSTVRPMPSSCVSADAVADSMPSSFETAGGSTAVPSPSAAGRSTFSNADAPAATSCGVSSLAAPSAPPSSCVAVFMASSPS